MGSTNGGIWEISSQPLNDRWEVDREIIDQTTESAQQEILASSAQENLNTSRRNRAVISELRTRYGKVAASTELARLDLTTAVGPEDTDEAFR